MQRNKLISEQPVESNICFAYFLLWQWLSKPTKVTHILYYCSNDDQVLTIVLMNFSFNWQTSMVGKLVIHTTLIVNHKYCCIT